MIYLDLSVGYTGVDICQKSCLCIFLFILYTLIKYCKHKKNDSIIPLKIIHHFSQAVCMYFFDLA